MIILAFVSLACVANLVVLLIMRDENIETVSLVTMMKVWGLVLLYWTPFAILGIIRG